jgi:hypothetical protein
MIKFKGKEVKYKINKILTILVIFFNLFEIYLVNHIE